MGIFSRLGKSVSKALDYISAPLAKPITTFTKGISAGAAEVKAQREKGLTISQGLKQIGVIAGTTAVAAGAVLAAAPAASTGAAGAAVRSAVVSTAKAAVPTTLKGKAIAAVAAPVIIGAVINQPAKIAEAVVKTPSALVNVGGNIANLAADPSIENIKTLVKENPVIVGGAAAAAAIVGAKTILPAIVTSRQIAATEKQTEAIEAATAGMSGGGISATQQQITPQLPATERIVTTATTTSKKRRKAAKKAVIQPISQRVNVVVQNKNTAYGIKNYLKRSVYA